MDCKTCNLPMDVSVEEETNEEVYVCPYCDRGKSTGGNLVERIREATKQDSQLMMRSNIFQREGTFRHLCIESANRMEFLKRYIDSLEEEVEELNDKLAGDEE